jgi:uncharacterized NAD(P)/FAD-binding protein YdhS
MIDPGWRQDETSFDDSSRRPPVDGPPVAIVGGGASGALCAAHLLLAARRAAVRIRITIVDRHGRYGPGLAYSTARPCHLLNVPAGRMSAFPDEPDHFLAWARRADPSTGPDTFAPRGLYGSYLTSVLASAERAAPAGALERVAGEVVSAAADPGGTIRLGLADGASIDAGCVIFAVGNLPREKPGWAADVECAGRFIASPYQPGAFDGVGDGDEVLLFGTGLTMVDAALDLAGKRPGAGLRAISRHGLLPHRHAPADPGAGARPVAAVEFDPAAGDPRDLVRAIRRAVEAEPRRWREVVDSLRPRSEELWNSFDDDARRLLLDRFGRYWAVHRHRMAPRVGERIDELLRTRRLRIDEGGVAGVDAGTRSVRVVQRDGGTLDRHYDWIVDCAGGPTDIARSPDTLMTQLIASGFANVHPLRRGVETDQSARIVARDGRTHPNAFALGPPRLGGVFETTAIPEIRRQAQALADQVLDFARVGRGPAAPSVATSR